MLRRSPTTFGVLLSFSFFAGLLTLLLLAQRTIPGRSTESLESLPTEVVGPSILQPTEQPAEQPTQTPSSQAGANATEPSVVTVPGGPVIIGPVSGLGPSDQVNEPAANPEKGKKPGDGTGGPPPAESDQPSPPAGGSAPSPPGGGVPSGQPTPPPGVLPSDPDEDDDDGSSGEDEVEGDDDETDTSNDGGEQAKDAKGGQKSGKGGGKDED